MELDPNVNLHYSWFECLVVGFDPRTLFHTVKYTADGSLDLCYFPVDSIAMEVRLGEVFPGE